MDAIREIKSAFPLVAQLESLALQRKMLHEILPMCLEIAEENHCLKQKLEQQRDKMKTCPNCNSELASN